MGSTVSVKAQLESQSHAWRVVLANMVEKDPTFVARYSTLPSLEAVLLELDRLRKIAGIA